MLNAETGGYLTIARRHGDDWYVGTINNSEARTLKINLDFLTAGTYRAELYQDAADVDKQPNHLTKTVKSLGNKDVLEIPIAAGGGQVMRLVKE